MCAEFGYSVQPIIPSDDRKHDDAPGVVVGNIKEKKISVIDVLENWRMKNDND